MARLISVVLVLAVVVAAGWAFVAKRDLVLPKPVEPLAQWLQDQGLASRPANTALTATASDSVVATESIADHGRVAHVDLSRSAGQAAGVTTADPATSNPRPTDDDPPVSTGQPQSSAPTASPPARNQPQADPAPDRTTTRDSSEQPANRAAGARRIVGHEPIPEPLAAAATGTVTGTATRTATTAPSTGATPSTTAAPTATSPGQTSRSAASSIAELNQTTELNQTKQAIRAPAAAAPLVPAVVSEQAARSAEPAPTRSAARESATPVLAKPVSPRAPAVSSPLAKALATQAAAAPRAPEKDAPIRPPKARPASPALAVPTTKPVGPLAARTVPPASESSQPSAPSLSPAATVADKTAARSAGPVVANQPAPTPRAVALLAPDSPALPPARSAAARAQAASISSVLRGRVVEFQVGRDRLTRAGMAVLDKIVPLIEQNPQTTIVIQGHTDDIGDDASNLELSGARAIAARAYLIGRGVDGRRLKVQAFGERQPIASNATPAGRIRNRRIDFAVSEPG